MITIYSFFFIATILTFSAGNFFLNIIYKKEKNYKFSLSEEGIIGLIFVSFISLFLNFFLKIDQLVASILFIFPLILLIRLYKTKEIELFKKIILHSLIISAAATIFISFDNVNRPDAGIYHLPYVKILNDFKIIIGSANFNPLFGATSIFQYISAIFNNYIFKDIGVTIPHALLSIYFIDYFLRNFFSNSDKDLFYKLFIFTLASYFLIEMNRYSDYGNDTPGHLFSFYLLSLFVKKDFNLENKENFKLFALISLFCFLNRPFLILFIFLAIYIWIKKKHFLSFSAFPIFSLFFLFFWMTKNILVSGCAIYPIKFTCFDNLSWYSNEAKFRIAARNSSEFSELHAKGWEDIIKNREYINYEHKTEEKQNYLKNFNWLNKDYISKHSHTFKKKIDFFILYLIIVSSCLYFLKDNKKDFNSTIKDERYKILIILSSIGLFLMIYKFPLGRYGTSYLAIFIYCIFFPIISFFSNKSSIKKNGKILGIFLIILSTLFFGKNINRIVKNYSADYNQSPWPRIYDNYFKISGSNKLQNLPIEFKKINKNRILDIYYINEENFYSSERKILCLYNKAPCTQTSENFKTFDVEIYKGYYFVKLNKV